MKTPLFRGLSSDQIAEEVERSYSRDCVDRSIWLSYGFALAFAIYGFTSLDFLKKFDDSVTLWNNVLLRVFLNSLPLVICARWMRTSRLSHRAKLTIWSTVFASIFHVAAWIYVWPIALGGSPGVLVFVNSANVYLLSLVYAVVAPSPSLLLRFSIPIALIFVGPLLVIAHSSNDSAIFNLITNDTIFAWLSGCLLGMTFYKLRISVIGMELDHKVEASRFLGPAISNAIFGDQRDIFQTRRIKGFVATLDIRDSTELQKRYGKMWLEFRRKYFSAVSSISTKYGGYIQKTVGDCHIINFGVMESHVDLSDVSGIETEEQQAEERRLARVSDNTFGCLEEIFFAFHALSEKHFPGELVRLGAGLDKGFVERGIQGDSGHLLELDVNGDPVNCSSRLQEYSKAVTSNFAAGASLLVASPFASDYISEARLNGFVRISVEKNPIRNYSQIKWVLVREFKREMVQSISEAA